jgi:hypothetical protein
MFKDKSAGIFRKAISDFHVECIKKSSPSLMSYLRLFQAFEKLFWGNKESHSWNEIKRLIEDTLSGMVRNK